MDDRSSLPVILLAIWIVACAALGGGFFLVRFPGFIDITIERILFLIIMLLLFVGLFRGKVDLQKNNTIEIFMGLFVLVCLVSMTQTGFLPVQPDFISPWFVFITGYLFPFVVFVFAKNYVLNEKDMLFILHTLFFFGIYLCITSFLEFFDLKQFVFPRYIADPELGIHWDRARGPFLNAPYNGVGILLGFISGIHLLQKKTGFSRVSYQFALLLFFPAVFFTLTRSVYLAMLVAVVILLGWYKTSFPKWKLISLPLVIVLIIGVANYARLLSTERRAGGVYQIEEVNIRFALLQRSVYLFSQGPFKGIGLAQFQPSTLRSYKGRTPYYSEYLFSQGPSMGIGLPQFPPSTLGSYKGRTPYYSDELTALQHNHLLGITTELGIPGIVLYLSIIILILRRLKQLAGELPVSGIMGNNLRVVIFSIWCVYLTNNLFLEPSNNLFVNAIPFLFAGLADGMYTRSRQSGLASSPSLLSRSPMRIINSHV
jgi:O-antigen ligase